MGKVVVELPQKVSNDNYPYWIGIGQLALKEIVFDNSLPDIAYLFSLLVLAQMRIEKGNKLLVETLEALNTFKKRALVSKLCYIPMNKKTKYAHQIIEKLKKLCLENDDELICDLYSIAKTELKKMVSKWTNCEY